MIDFEGMAEGLAAENFAIYEAVEWFLEVWETPPPKYDVSYDECEASLIKALQDVANAVGITRPIKHWMDTVSEATEKSTDMNLVGEKAQGPE